MKHCDDIQLLISAQLDGELTDQQTQALAEHLAQCPDCTALAADLATMHAAMPALNVTPPAFLVENVMARMKAEAAAPLPFPAKKNRRRQWQSLGAMAAVLAVVLVGSFALRGNFDQTGGAAPVSLDAPPPLSSPTAQPSAALADLPQAYSSVEDATPSETPLPAVAPLETPAPSQAGASNYTAPAGGAEREASVAKAVPSPRAVPPLAAAGEAPVATPAPTPSPEPVPPVTATPTTGEAAPRMATALMGAQTPSVTAEVASQRLFTYLKELNYPNLGTTTPWEGAILSGSAENEDLTYTLGLVTINGEACVWKLTYQGLSQNRNYHEFNLLADVTAGEETRTVQGGWYGVSVAEGAILTWQDDPEVYDATVTEQD